MQVDSDIGYIGEYHGGYNYDAYCPYFGGDLGMLECINPGVTNKNDSNSQEQQLKTTATLKNSVTDSRKALLIERSARFQKRHESINCANARLISVIRRT